MYLLDTNVISELRRPAIANRRVWKWAQEVQAADLFLSVITILEVEQGILRLQRKDPDQAKILRAWMENWLLVKYADRILPIDTIVSRRCARLHIPDPLPERDAFIAATALVHGLIVVTRNTKDFHSCGVELFDPWKG